MLKCQKVHDTLKYESEVSLCFKLIKSLTSLQTGTDERNTLHYENKLFETVSLPPLSTQQIIYGSSI